MKKISTISSKGQVVIPKEIRDLFSFRTQTKVIFEINGEGVFLKPYQKSKSTLDKKLANFSTDPDFRKSWERSLKKRTGSW